MRRDGGDENDGVVVLDDDGAVGLFGNTTGLQR
jgi:hypothetical protein